MQYHGNGWVVRIYRGTTASVLDVTVLTRARVEQGAEAIGCTRRGGCRYPDLGKQSIADVKVMLTLQAEVGGKM